MSASERKFTVADTELKDINVPAPEVERLLAAKKELDEAPVHIAAEKEALANIVDVKSDEYDVAELKQFHDELLEKKELKEAEQKYNEAAQKLREAYQQIEGELKKAYDAKTRLIDLNVLCRKKIEETLEEVDDVKNALAEFKNVRAAARNSAQYNQAVKKMKEHIELFNSDKKYKKFGKLVFQFNDRKNRDEILLELLETGKNPTVDEIKKFAAEVGGRAYFQYLLQANLDAKEQNFDNLLKKLEAEKDQVNKNTIVNAQLPAIDKLGKLVESCDALYKVFVFDKLRPNLAKLDAEKQRLIDKKAQEREAEERRLMAEAEAQDIAMAKEKEREREKKEQAQMATADEERKDELMFQGILKGIAQKAEGIAKEKQLQADLRAADFVMKVGAKLSDEAEPVFSLDTLLKEQKVAVQDFCKTVGITQDDYKQLERVKEHYVQQRQDYKAAKEFMFTCGFMEGTYGKNRRTDLSSEYKDSSFLNKLFDQMKESRDLNSTLFDEIDGVCDALTKSYNTNTIFNLHGTGTSIADLVQQAFSVSDNEKFDAYLSNIVEAPRIVAIQRRIAEKQEVKKIPVEQKAELKELPSDEVILRQVAQFFKNLQPFCPEDQRNLQLALKISNVNELNERELRGKLESIVREIRVARDVVLHQARNPRTSYGTLNTLPLKELKRLQSELKITDKGFIILQFYEKMKDVDFAKLSKGDLVRCAEQILKMDKDVIQPMKDARLVQVSEKTLSALSLIANALNAQLAQTPEKQSGFPWKAKVEHMIHHALGEIQENKKDESGKPKELVYVHYQQATPYSKLADLRQDLNAIQKELEKFRQKKQPPYIEILFAVQTYLADKNIDALKAALTKFVPVYKAPAKKA